MVFIPLSRKRDKNKLLPYPSSPARAFTPALLLYLCIIYRIYETLPCSYAYR